MSAASSKPEDTPEQVEIKSIRQGFHVVSANAGTGKTHTLSDLIVLLYLEEERKLFPDTPRGGHVAGQDQLTILKQILAITFTRDAAKELDERIYARFAEIGVPAPVDPWGKHFRICRTIDSFVQSWMRRPQVIRKLLRVDPDISGSLKEKLGKLNPAAAAAMKEESKGDAEIGFFRCWPWLRGDHVDDLIFESIHRTKEDAIPGINPDEWQAQFDTFLAALPPPASDKQSEGRRKWGTQFWGDKLAAWETYRKEMRELNDRFKRGELAGHENYQQFHLALEVWDKQNGAKKEFFSVLEIARSRGYHPVRSPEKLAALAVLQELAACDHWDDFVHFHQFALQFYAMKLRYGVMDHADFLIACVDTFEQFEELVERDREYPRWGIRAKYVLYDEVQDNSVSNNRLFRVLCAKKGVPYLAVAVGDAKQAIYGFRGACSYGFGQMIDAVKKRNPENIHHLTCSFRSLSKIVALGNETVQTLPDYKATVHPSHTVYQEPGDVIIAPPIADEKAESDWVLQRVRQTLFNTAETVMVLHRNNLHDHPIVAPLKSLLSEYPQRLQVMTIHRSKGLQAHHVFVMGMTATLMPDVRTSFTQMVNLLYVALTRPRKALYITAPYTLLKANKEGVLEPKEVGPSPFILRVPSLCALAERSGWPLFMLEKGETTTAAAAGMLTARIGGKDSFLRRQWRQLWPAIPIKDAEGDEYTDETGSAAPDARVKFISRRSLYEGGQLVIDGGPRLDEGLKERVRVKVRQAWLKNGQPPKLSKDEYITALRQGWLEKQEGSRSTSFTQKLIDEIEAA